MKQFSGETTAHRMLASKSIQLPLTNKTFQSDINRNAVSDSQVPLPINIVRLSHNGSLPLPFIFPFPSRFLTRLVLTACNILVAAMKYPRKTFPLPEGKQRCPIKSRASYGETTGQRAPGSAIKK